MMNHYYDELTNLAKQAQEGIHVSLFMPLEREPDNLEANHARLKKLIQAGQRQVTADGFMPPESPLPDLEKFFEPILALQHNGRLAGESGQSLALFLTADDYHLYRLPLPLEEMIVIGPRFHIKPLLPLINHDGRFYLLTLGQNQAQLWQGNQFHLEPVETVALPPDSVKMLMGEDPERSQVFHDSRAQDEDSPLVFPEGGLTEEAEKAEILRPYLRQVNDGVQARLAAQTVPLLLAAVPYLWPLYAQVNTYPYLLSEGIVGDPEPVNAAYLHQQGWHLVQQECGPTKSMAIRQYQDGIRTQNTSHSVAEIVAAAAGGQVGVLLVPRDVQVWGRFSPASGQVEVSPVNTFNNEDLLNLAAAITLLQGGRIYAVQPDEVPGEPPMAAIFQEAA